MSGPSKVYVVLDHSADVSVVVGVFNSKSDAHEICKNYCEFHEMDPMWVEVCGHKVL